MQCMQYIYTA